MWIPNLFLNQSTHHNKNIVKTDKWSLKTIGYKLFIITNGI